MPDMKPPDSWKKMSLGEVLPPEALQPVTDALNKARARQIPAGKTMSGYFKEVLAPYEKQLEAKGVLHEYLAFYLEWLVTSGKLG